MSEPHSQLVAECLSGDADAAERLRQEFAGLALHVVRVEANLLGRTLDEAEQEILAADVLADLTSDGCRPLMEFRGRSDLTLYLAIVASRFAVQRLARSPRGVHATK